MCLIKNIFQYFYICTFIIWVNCFGGKNGIRLDRLEACGYSPNAPIRWDEVKFENYADGSCSMFSRAEILHDIPKLLITLDVQRCSSKESLDSCQLFAKLNPLDTCQFLLMKGTAWTRIVESFEPRVKCPVKKGHYISKNATFNPNLSFLFPLDSWYWKIVSKVMDRGEYMNVCMDFQSYKVTRS